MQNDTAQNKFTFLDGAMICLFAVVANIVLQMAVSIVLQIFGIAWILDIDWVGLLFSLVLQIMFVGVILIYCKKHKTRFDLTPKPVKPLGYIVPVITAIICIVCFYFLAVAFEVLLDFMHYEGTAGVELDSLAAKIIGIFVTVICAPIGEELIFRGALLSGLRQRFNAPVAIVLSGLAFSLMHMNPEQTVYQFMIGCVCAYLTLKSGSLLPAMITHGVSNLIACLMEIIPSFGTFVDFLINSLLSMPWLFMLVFVLGVVIGVVAIFFLGKLVGDKDKEQEKNFTATPPVQDTAENSQQVKTERLSKMSANTAYWLSVGICAFMWLALLAVGIMTGCGLFDFLEGANVLR